MPSIFSCLHPALLLRGLLVCCALLLAACSNNMNIAPAEAEVVKFHEMLLAGRHTEIYEAGTADFKKTNVREEFLNILGNVNRKLGRVKSSKRNGWNVSTSFGGSFVALSYQTEFEGGTALETFTYNMKDGRATLAGYNVAAAALEAAPVTAKPAAT